jgi:alpha-tubulin suppressor-like RCC1 family protein
MNCGADADCSGGFKCTTGCTPWKSVSVGNRHTCAVRDTGNVRCWGKGNRGQLGYAATENIGDDETPASAGDVDVGASVIQLDGGIDHTCALLDTAEVRCWGDGGDGQLGYGNTNPIGDTETPASAGDVKVGGVVVRVVAGKYHSCALLANDEVSCWGKGGAQLGYPNVTGNIGDDELPSSVGYVNVGGAVVGLAAGGDHTCALLDTGKVRCWGRSDSGQLGYANTDQIGDDETPASAGDVDVGGTVVQIAAGDDHTCALLALGTVRCWGQAASGRLGYGNTNIIGDNESPASAGDVDVGGAVVQIAAGGYHTCALLDTGKVRCWGLGVSGELGYGNTKNIGDDEAPSAAADVNVGGVVIQIATGFDHTCALLATGEVRCWGEAQYGELGYGNATDIGDNEYPYTAGDVPWE